MNASRKSRRSRGCAQAAVALLALALPSCVRKEDVRLAFDDGRFNDRVRGDFRPLTAQDFQGEPGFGFFRHQSEAAVVSEVFPVSMSDGTESISGRLVQTPCLFVGQAANGRASADELRVGWELIGNVDRNADDFLRDNFKEGYEELGLCTMSSPVNRLLFEHPELPLREEGNSGLTCGPAGEAREGPVDLRFTLSSDPSENANMAGYCILGHAWPEVVLQAYPPEQADPDGLCPAAGKHFIGVPVQLGDLRSACGFPAAGLLPAGDASYRLSLTSGHSFGSANPERWLSPSVMLVNGARNVVREMAGDGFGGFQWQTPVSTGSNDQERQWAENYMPTLLVERVEILSRDASGGGEQNEAPANDRLTIFVPRPDTGADSVTCTGSVKDGVFSFSIPADCGVDEVELRALTPTYAPFHLRSGEAPVTTPITWTVSLPSLPPARTAFIRFSVRVEDTPRGALRISPAKDFGRLQVNHWRQDSLFLRNEGPEVEVRSVAFGPASQHPGDFSFVVAGDPVEVPLPIEARPDGAGVALGFSPDAAEAPILKVEDDGSTVEVSLGEPARGDGTEPLKVYGEEARLVGGLFLRDDPAATPAPSAPSHPRPFGIVALAERRPPFLLGRNESVRIVVTARPTDVGVRSAEIWVEAVPVGTPATLWVASQVSADALAGPQLHGLPERLILNGDQQGQFSRDDARWALIENVGHFDLQVTALAIAGRDAGRFALATSGGGAPPPPPFTLAPGAAQDLQVVYAPECDGSYTFWDHEAVLMVESNGGNWQLPLYGYSLPYCP